MHLLHLVVIGVWIRVAQEDVAEIVLQLDALSQTSFPNIDDQ